MAELTSHVAGRLGVPVPELIHRSPGLPLGSGLGSSGALTVAVAYATALDAEFPPEPEAGADPTVARGRR